MFHLLLPNSKDKLYKLQSKSVISYLKTEHQINITFLIFGQ